MLEVWIVRPRPRKGLARCEVPKNRRRLPEVIWVEKINYLINVVKETTIHGFNAQFVMIYIPFVWRNVMRENNNWKILFMISEVSDGSSVQLI